MDLTPREQQRDGVLVSPWRIPAVRLVLVVALLGFFSYFLTLSALPLYAVASGTASGAAGLVTVAMLACTIATQMAVPALAGRFGANPVLVIGALALGAPAPLYLLSHELWWLMVVSAVRGAGFAVVTVLLPLLVMGAAPEGKRGEAMGVFGLAIAVTNLIAVPVGVALTGRAHFGWVAYLAAAPVCVVLLLPALRGAKWSSEGAGPPPAPEGADLVPTADDVLPLLRRIAGTVLVLFTVTVAGGGLLTYLPIERTQGSLATVALLVFGVTSAAARWRSGLLSDRIGDRLLFPAGPATVAVGMLMIAAGLSGRSSALDDVLILCGAGVTGVGYGGAQSISLLVALRLAGPRRAATTSAVWNAAFDGGTATGALAVGLVAAGIGLPWTFVCCAATVAATVWPAVRGANAGVSVRRPERGRRPPDRS